jgi:hypothetical protein
MQRARSCRPSADVLRARSRPKTSPRAADADGLLWTRACRPRVARDTMATGIWRWNRFRRFDVGAPQPDPRSRAAASFAPPPIVRVTAWPAVGAISFSSSDWAGPPRHRGGDALSRAARLCAAPASGAPTNQAGRRVVHTLDYGPHHLLAACSCPATQDVWMVFTGGTRTMSWVGGRNLLNGRLRSGASLAPAVQVALRMRSLLQRCRSRARCRRLCNCTILAPVRSSTWPRQRRS